MTDLPPDDKFMQRAIELAGEAVGRVSPNPPVGAVLVKGGRIVGEGWTQAPGGAHAEIVALREAGEAARGATLCVTLEPCCHHGRTPPCVDALLEAGIAAVRIAVVDPNPRVQGNGIERLRSAGVAVTVDHGPDEAHELVESFAKHMTTGLPFVTAKFAMSLDGKIATRTGDSRWISNEASRLIAHQLRAQSDAVMVGIGTALADDPLLTVRDVPLMRDAQPLRVVVDSTGRLLPDAAMFSEPGKTLVAVARVSEERRRALAAAGAEVLAAAGAEGRVDLSALLEHLGARDVTSVLVEGGAGLLGALFDSGLVDKVVTFVAPVIIGGKKAPTAVAGRGAEHMSGALHLDRVRYEEANGDIIVTGYPPASPPSRSESSRR